MTTIREALESAAESLETGGDGGAAPAEVEAAPPPPSEGGDEAVAPLASGDEGTPSEPAAAAEDKGKPGEAGRSRDASGRFAQGAKPEAPAPVRPRPSGVGTPVKPLPTGPSLSPAPGAAQAPVKPAAPAADGPKPPSSWKPAARDAWATLPPAVRAEVARVDKEVVTTLRESASARQFTGYFNQAIAPYQAMINSEGANPPQFIGGLLQTAQALRTAPPGHKAQLVANIVRQFGVPIEALDAALAGGPVPQGQQQGGGQQGGYQDPRVDQLLATIQQRGHERQQEQWQRVQSEVEEFKAAHEFAEDVREDMAALLHAGRAKDMEDAYNKACRMNSEVADILRQREAAKAANASQASTQRARAAASSVKGRPAGSASAPAGNSVRAALEAAAARLNSR